MMNCAGLRAWSRRRFQDFSRPNGAGQIGLTMLTAAREQGLVIVAVVDCNPKLHGLLLLDYRIISLEEAMRLDCDGYLVASVAFARAIEETIRRCYENLHLRVPTVLALGG
ncbi:MULTISPECIES: hypothetical protein [Thiorhodovibrio]|uniref:hypothetical protein n=1 Tax=Thiorhodovibrio TaxID=61593 RepID=UPI001911C145|nr:MULTISPECIES: hypothetical protein [Thiorhodovibrio]MBK5967903.1 hypothetical protein [Thiorhodovibrio winogradskyi]